MRAALIALAIGAIGVPAAATAQLAGRVAVTGAYVRARAADPLATTTRGGLAAGIRAAGTYRQVGVEIRYVQGRLDSAGLSARKFVDLGALATLRAGPWVTLLAGPRAHALGDDGGGTRRWLFWTAASRVESPRFAQRHFAVFGELWVGIGVVNERDGAPHTLGIETGLLAWVPGVPFHGRLAYRLDDGRLDDGGLRSTLESIAIGVGYSF